MNYNCEEMNGLLDNLFATSFLCYIIMQPLRMVDAYIYTVHRTAIQHGEWSVVNISMVKEAVIRQTSPGINFSICYWNNKQFNHNS